MKGTDLAAALTAPVPGRGAQDGARSAAPAGDAGRTSFGAVLSDVQDTMDSVQGLAPSAGRQLAGDAPDNAPSGALTQGPGGGTAAAQDLFTVPADTALPADTTAAADTAAALSGGPSPSGVPAQLAAVIQPGPPQPLTAVPGVPAKGSQRHFEAHTAGPVTATPGPAAAPVASGRLAAVPVATGPAADVPVAHGPGAAFPVACGPVTVAGAPEGVPEGKASTVPSGAQQPAGPLAQDLALSSAGVVAPATVNPAPGTAPPAGNRQGTGPVGTATLMAMAPAAAAVPATPSSVVPATAATPSSAAPLHTAPAGGASGFPAAALAEGSNAVFAHAEPAPVPAPAGAPLDALAAAGGAAAAPASQPASSVAAVPQPAPSQPVALLQAQLAQPLFRLAAAPQGQHIMTLQVSPEDLGPMTVRAHIDAAGVRIELFAPGDAGREAIRGILPELRKELAAAGFGASLDVSAHNGPGSSARDGSGQDPTGRNGTGNGAGRDSGDGPGNHNGPGDPRPGHRWEALADDAALRNTRILNGPHTTLDILV